MLGDVKTTTDTKQLEMLFVLYPPKLSDPLYYETCTH